MGEELAGREAEVDYIYFCHKWGRRNQVKVVQEKIAGIFVMKIIVIQKRGKGGERRETESENKIIEMVKKTIRKKLKRKLGKKEPESCVVGADLIMAKYLHIDDELFRGRKKELLVNREKILSGTAFTGRKPQPGDSFLLVLESGGWSEQEVLALLQTAKDYYKDLNIVMNGNHINASKLSKILYEEFGVVLHFLSEQEGIRCDADFSLFLLEKWQERIYRYHFRKGYVVAEQERGMVRNKMEGRLCSGFAYASEKTELPYQMGVDIFYQNPKLYEKFVITCIDIYSL